MGARRTPFWKTLADEAVLFLLLFLVWTVLAGTSTQELVAGVVASLPVVIANMPFFNLDTTSQSLPEQRPRDMLRVLPRPRRRQHNDEALHERHL